MYLCKFNLNITVTFAYTKSYLETGKSDKIEYR